VIIADTGPLVAGANERDFHHERCAELLECRAAADYGRAAELVQQYSNLPLGAVDAFVIAVAERAGATEVATLDRRHFSIVQPKHIAAFTLLPG